MITSRPAISRAESANQPVPSEALLAAWARACGVPVEEFTEIVQRAKSGTPEWFVPYLSAEQAATRLRFWEPNLVPGLLQTKAYTRAYEKSDDVVRIRLERQQVIGKARITAVVDHRVLTHAIGSAEIMSEQCAHLGELAESEKITLHVMPEGANTGLGGALAMASHKGLVTVSMSTTTRDITSTAADMVEEAQTAFDAILGIALAPVPSLEYLRSQEERWKSQI
jgi:transcriptional regulator with XRE-family HTH domain